jgi:NADH-quinone oxidoreductase subunit H
MSTILFFLPFLVIFVVFAVWAERKIGGFIHDRLGPTDVGYKGLLQTVADLIKLIQKEDSVPKVADKPLFLLAPVLIFMAVFTGFSVVPLSAAWSGSPIETGVLFLLAIVSLDVIGILMAGWGSNSKYTLFGAMRSVAQIISYEVPLGLSIIAVAMICQSLDLQQITLQQGIWNAQYGNQEALGLLGIFKSVDLSSIGGFLTWNIIRFPLLIPAFFIFFIAGLAESNRAPFDLPEAESELVGGFQTEYSGFRWSVIMLAEYGMMLLISYLAAILFLGGWYSPLPNIGSLQLALWTNGVPGSLESYLWGGFWITSKAIFLILVMVWVRFTFPRLRIDQLMSLCWKYLTPAALLIIFVAAFWRLGMI